MIKVMFSCGGTGGHIFPAVALSKEFKKQNPDAEIVFGGRNKGMEFDKLNATESYFGIEAYPLRRGKIVENISLPFRLLKSILDAKKILKKQNVNLVIATGGYVTLPFLLAAKWLKIPYYLQEQNVYAGVTNKIAGRWAKKVFVPSEECVKWFRHTPCEVSGNPVRQINEALVKPKEFEGFDKVILVLGGSQGARGVNKKVASWLDQKEENTLIYWQTGLHEFDYYTNLYKDRDDVKIVNFIEGIYSYMKFADVIISRSGASTIAELNLLGKGALFIPYPFAAENHQEENARSLEKQTAALVELESENCFAELLNQLLESDDLRKKLDENSLKMAKPNASEEIIRNILKEESI